MLTLAEAKVAVADYVPAADATQRINLACERIAAMGKWKGLMVRLSVTVRDGVFTLPMDYATCHRITDRAGMADQPRPPWYEFLKSGWGTPTEYNGYPVPIDRGDGHCMFRDLPVADAEGLQFVAEESADTGDSIVLAGEGPPLTAGGSTGTGVPVVSGAGTSKVNGTYAMTGSLGGKPVYTFNDVTIQWMSDRWEINDGTGVLYHATPSTDDYPWDASGWAKHLGTNPAPTVAEGASSSVGGTYGEPSRYTGTHALPFTIPASTFTFTKLTSVTKPRGDGRVFVVGATSGELLAIYEPRDTKINFRRYEMPYAGIEESGVDTQTVVAYCKKAYRKAEVDADEVIIDSEYALRSAMLAIQYRDEADVDRSEAEWKAVYRHLDDALGEHRGPVPQTLPVKSRAFRGYKMRARR